MRISDWSSDVCSSDLLADDGIAAHPAERLGDLARGHSLFPHRLERIDAFVGPGHVGPSKSFAGLRAAAAAITRSQHEQPAPFRRNPVGGGECPRRSEEHTSELQSLMRISYAVFCLKKKQYFTISIMHIFSLHNQLT